jgi:hypothetical protein
MLCGPPADRPYDIHGWLVHCLLFNLRRRFRLSIALLLASFRHAYGLIPTPAKLAKVDSAVLKSQLSHQMPFLEVKI